MKPKDKQLTAILALAGAVILMLFAGSEKKAAQKELEATINAPADAKYDPRAWMKESETDWSECELTEEIGPHMHSDDPEEVKEQHILLLGDQPVLEESGLIMMKDGYYSFVPGFVPGKDSSHMWENTDCPHLQWDIGIPGHEDAAEMERIERELEEMAIRLQLLLIIQELVEELERRPVERPSVPNLSEQPKEVIA